MQQINDFFAIFQKSKTTDYDPVKLVTATWKKLIRKREIS
jgi:hypothetical protein